MALVDLLRQAPLFSGLEDSLLEALAASMVERTFVKGRILFYKGSPGNSLYLVESGLVRIFVLSETGQEVTLTLQGIGECFGELALLDGAPRSTGAVAQDTTVAHTLARADFLHLLDSQPLLARRLLALLAQRLRRLTAHTGSLAFLERPDHHHLFADPDSALTGYDLTGYELLKLNALDFESMESFAGVLDDRISKAFTFASLAQASTMAASAAADQAATVAAQQAASVAAARLRHEGRLDPRPDGCQRSCYE